MCDSRVQAMFEQSRYNSLSLFITTQGYYELPKRTLGVNGNIYHIFKPRNFRDLQKIYQDKHLWTDMTLAEFQTLTSICWNEKNQPLVIDKTKDR